MSQENKDNSNIFATKVIGDAMWPLLDDNTVVIIKKDAEPKNRDFVLIYQKSSNQTMIRRILLDGGQTILEPINNKFSSYEFDSSSDYIIGVAIQISKNLS